MPRDEANEKPPADMMCNCLLLCRDVHMSVLGNHTLVGVMSDLGVQKLPAVIGPFALYVRVTNIHGLQSLKLSFNRADDDSPLIVVEGKIEHADPLGTHTLVMQVPPVKIVAEGRYIWHALANGNPMASTTVTIKVQPPPPGLEEE